MPIVTVQVLAGTTHEQKREAVRGITDVMVSALGKKRDSVQVVFNDIDQEDWGIAGDTVAGHRVTVPGARPSEFGAAAGDCVPTPTA